MSETSTLHDLHEASGKVREMYGFGDRLLMVASDRMLRNLEASHGLVFSGRVLLRLVEAGMSREDAYAVVQRNALRAWDEELPLRGLLEADPDASALTPSALDEIFDLESFLVHVDEIFDRTLTTSEVAHV